MISGAEAQRIITERKDASFTVYQYRGGLTSLELRLPENPRVNLRTPLDDALLAALKEKGIADSTLIEDQDFHNGGVRGWLPVLSTFIVVAGAVLLLRLPGTKKYRQQEIATPRSEKREKNIMAVCAALVLIAMSLTLVLFMIAHPKHVISGAEARNIIAQHKNARFEVVQYDDGSKELWITLTWPSRTYPGFIAPADESTLALLAENQISYRTMVQGRDFGYRDPSKWMLLLGIFILPAGAIYLLWRVVKETRTPPPSAESCA